MTEHRPSWPTDQPPQERGLFQGYGKPATREAVLAAFVAKYGYAPAHVHHTGGGWLVGPIEEKD